MKKVVITIETTSDAFDYSSSAEFYNIFNMLLHTGDDIKSMELKDTEGVVIGNISVEE